MSECGIRPRQGLPVDFLWNTLILKVFLPHTHSLTQRGMSSGTSEATGIADAAMQKLASAVDAAEALEASGKYVEAADSVAKSLTVAYQEYVQSKNSIGPSLARPPQMPLPRRSYVERYKRRLRVDWEKWDRASRRPAPALTGIQVEEGFGEEEDADGDADDDDDVAGSLHELSMDGSEETDVSSPVLRGSRAQSWQPKTLVKNWTTAADGSATGKVEIVHTCVDGKRAAVTLLPPDIPPRAQRMFNSNAKGTIKSLIEGDKELTDRTFSCTLRPSTNSHCTGQLFRMRPSAPSPSPTPYRFYFPDNELALSLLTPSHPTLADAELACWMLTSDKMSKMKLGDYLGRSDDHAIGTMTALLGQLEFSQARALLL